MIRISKNGIAYHYYPEKDRQYYEANREKIIARSTKRNKANPEKRALVVKNNNKRSVRRKRAWHDKKYFGQTITRDFCKVCLVTTGLQVHHMDGDNGMHGKPLNNDPKNLIVLCNSCHHKYHNQHWVRPVPYQLANQPR